VEEATAAAEVNDRFSYRDRPRKSLRVLRFRQVCSSRPAVRFRPSLASPQPLLRVWPRRLQRAGRLRRRRKLQRAPVGRPDHWIRRTAQSDDCAGARHVARASGAYGHGERMTGQRTGAALHQRRTRAAAHRADQGAREGL